MPSQSWLPLIGGIGLGVMATSMSLKASGQIPYMGWIAIAGLSATVISIFLWALEGPGGYHLHFHKKGEKHEPAVH